MASVVSNLVYRVSVSAIVGAVVAAGLIYMNNDRVVKSYRAELSAQTEQQAITNITLIEASESLALAISALETKIDAIPVIEAADYSEITAAIADLNTDIAAKIDAVETSIIATQEQN